MKISRGFVKVFLFVFFIFILLSIAGLLFNFYSNWMGYTLIGFLIFIGVLMINKRNPRFGKFLIIVFVIAIFIILILKYVPLDFLKRFSSNENVINYLVSEVISGDTFKTNDGKEKWLACVIAPAIDEEGYNESKTFLEELILEKEIKVKKVENSSLSKSEGVYAFLDIDGTEIFVNKQMIDNNFAEYYEEDSENELCNYLKEL